VSKGKIWFSAKTPRRVDAQVSYPRSYLQDTPFDNSREDGNAVRQREIAAFDTVVPIQTVSDRDAEAFG
jgi:hypothetical protein